MILPFSENKGIFQLIIDRFVGANLDCELVLATTNQPGDDPLAALAQSAGLKVYRGSEHDVLDRFNEAAKLHPAETIVRVCCDNPFLIIDGVVELLRHFDPTKMDYLSYAFDGDLPVIKSHLGLFVEVMSRQALVKASELAESDLYREHVTNFMYEHPQHFRLEFLKLPNVVRGRMDLRFTVDTLQDFTISQEIYNNIGEGFKLDELVQFVDSNPSLHLGMKEQIDKNNK